jgi:hypothetical protein
MTRPLRFPPRHHALTASLRITEIPALVASVRGEVARILREMARDEHPAVAARLREIADLFEAPTPEPPEGEDGHARTSSRVPDRPRR